jgi:hypothetical protein
MLLTDGSQLPLESACADDCCELSGVMALAPVV